MFFAFSEKKYPFSDWLLIAALIIVSDDTLIFGTNSNLLFVSFKFAFIVLVAIFGFLKYALLDHALMLKESLVFFILALLCLLSSFVNGELLKAGILYKIVLFVYALSITKKFKFNHFAEIFSEVMLFLCLYSLIFWVVGVVDKSILAFLPVMKNSMNLEYYNVLFAQIRVSGFELRNTGMFREPGVFQMFIGYAFLFNIYLQSQYKKQNKRICVWRNYVFIVALITTFSTTGYIALACLIILFFKSNMCIQTVKVKKIIVAILIITILPLIVNLPIVIETLDSVFGKFNNVERHTTIARFASITENYRILISSPIFGVGLTKLSELFPIYALKTYGFATEHNTNMTMIQFATHGFAYGAIFCLLNYSFCKKIFFNVVDSLLAFAFFLIIYCGENLTFSVITYIFIFYGTNINYLRYKNNNINKIEIG